MEVSGGFLFFIALLYYVDNQNLLFSVLLSCALHELGHYCAIKLCGGHVRRLRVTIIGAEMEMAGGLSYIGELISALAGPSVNLVLALFFARVIGAAMLAGINLSLALFNLLPLSRLDGGRSIHIILCLLTNPSVAARCSALTDRILCYCLLLLSILLFWQGGNFTLCMVAGWLCAKTSHQKVGKAKERKRLARAARKR